MLKSYNLIWKQLYNILLLSVIAHPTYVIGFLLDFYSKTGLSPKNILWNISQSYTDPKEMA